MKVSMKNFIGIILLSCLALGLGGVLTIFLMLAYPILGAICMAMVLFSAVMTAIFIVTARIEK